MRSAARSACASLALVVVICCASRAAATERLQSNRADVRPLRQAHAHNDYEHERPLLDALDHGFSSVEADLHLVDGRLLVAHDPEDVRRERTLEALYLEPLRERVEQNGGAVYRSGREFFLLIDIKTDGEATYAALRELLAHYSDILTAVRDGQAKPGPVTVVISGNRPQQTMAAERVRYAGIDGRLSDLESEAPAHLVPWISDNWRNHFRWEGVGDFPPQERQKLRAIVEQAHAAGRKVRFWATPDVQPVWRELAAADVDLINTDDLAGLERFLRNRAH